MVQDSWIGIDELKDTIALIEQMAEHGGTWQWWKNPECKYVSIRIDMRDGGFIILGRDGKRISLADIQYQYGDANAPID